MRERPGNEDGNLKQLRAHNQTSESMLAKSNVNKTVLPPMFLLICNFLSFLGSCEPDLVGICTSARCIFHELRQQGSTLGELARVF